MSNRSLLYTRILWDLKEKDIDFLEDSANDPWLVYHTSSALRYWLIRQDVLDKFKKIFIDTGLSIATVRDGKTVEIPTFIKHWNVRRHSDFWNRSMIITNLSHSDGEFVVFDGNHDQHKILESIPLKRGQLIEFNLMNYHWVMRATQELCMLRCYPMYIGDIPVIKD